MLKNQKSSIQYIITSFASVSPFSIVYQSFSSFSPFYAVHHSCRFLHSMLYIILVVFSILCCTSFLSFSPFLMYIFRVVFFFVNCTSFALYSPFCVKYISIRLLLCQLYIIRLAFSIR